MANIVDLYNKFNEHNDYVIESIFKAYGYLCVVIGSRHGYRCGYIGIPEGHPLYKKNFYDIDIEIHGGFSYADNTKNYPIKTNDRLWWIGFDCAHSGDRVDLNLIKRFGDKKLYSFYGRHNQKKAFIDESLKNTEYVEHELVEAVKQIKDMK